MPILIREKYWILETAQTAYAFGVTPRGRLVHSYWGARLPFPEDYPIPHDTDGWASFNGPGHALPEEYPAYAGPNYGEPCLKATFADGVRDTVLQFVDTEITTGELPEVRVTLRDVAYPLAVVLCYRVHAQHDLIERWVELTNTGTTPVTLERVWSALWRLPWGEEYRLSHVFGRWFEEWQLRREVLQPGVKVKESRRITTSHNASPWFAIDRGNADEDQGAVWFGVLAWGGNWKLAAEVTESGATRLGIGLNDWDFAWRLMPGETFTTPASLAGYTANGFGAASRTLHDYAREHLP
ncbi:glycoside hydrolase family 36 N-terminal domain-containing protein, partial [Caldilinea sp.]|uniref:glycoside hydrolase family 36 N-terminal domain-containing protein n=1 Tax=Caldilinea sp. TaxID=2293560 RepID=UPI002CAC9539|nr:glycoside hydrolase family 36 N-terminal domain-containing protein [Caldilinea sp.]